MAVKKSLRDALRRHRRIKFRRYLWHTKRKLRDSGWRRPRGIHNIDELHKAKEMAEAKQKEGDFGIAVRIASGVGARKREMLVAEAERLGLKVLNP